jgi:glycosyltransferase involved in cell wall biosynthesis
VTARVAVIVPCHDDRELVREAVASIEEPEPVELVVIDDASTDRATIAVLEELGRSRVRVLTNEVNLGLGPTRNRGLEATSAPYVFPLDADDLAVPGTFARMADLLDANPSASFCVGDYEEFGSRNAVRVVGASLDPFRIAYRNEFGAALLRREALLAIGGWVPRGGKRPEEIHGYEDWHVWMALAERNATGVHAGPGVVTYRRRLADGRLLAEAQGRHRELYRNLRALHPDLFRNLREHRRRSDLGISGRYLYPLLFGARPRLGIESRVIGLLGRMRLPVPGRRAS